MASNHRARVRFPLTAPSKYRIDRMIGSLSRYITIEQKPNGFVDAKCAQCRTKIHDFKKFIVVPIKISSIRYIHYYFCGKRCAMIFKLRR